MSLTYPLLTGWFDAFASAPSHSADIGTGSNRYLVGLVGSTDGGLSVTGMRVDTNSMTALNALYTDGSGRDWRAFGYDVSGISGSKVIDASFSGSPITGGSYMVVLVIQGTNSLTIADVTACSNSNTDGGGGNDPSVTISAANGVTVIALAIDLTGAVPTGLSGDTLISSASGIADASYEVSAGGSTTVGLDYGAFIETVMIGFSVTETASGGKFLRGSPTLNSRVMNSALLG